LLRKKTASLAVCEGRRRIGKSTLIRECAKEAQHFLVFEGLPPRPNLGCGDQLKAFATQLAEQTHVPEVPLESWPKAFQLLARLLPPGRTVLLLDEISWMATGEPDFAGYFKIGWDQLFSRREGRIVVLCGSVSSWIQENILNQTGFVGRCSWEFSLPPLSLPACNAFWGEKTVSAPEKLKLLAVTGGVVQGRLADGERHHKSIISRSAALVQPFVPGILSGEYSLVFVNGSYSHAILRSPPPKYFRVSPNGAVKAVSAPREMVNSALSALAQVPGIDQCLYARVDGIPSNGGLLIMEVELIDPCLWFDLHPAGACALAAALAERVRAGRKS
jgi:hypothetical protein